MFSNMSLPAFICLLARNCSHLSKLAMGKGGLGAEGRRFLRHVCICMFQRACMTFKHGLVTRKFWYENEVQRQGKRFPISASFLFSKMHSADVRRKFSPADGHRLYFTGAELDYAYFIHSLFFLSRLLAFTNGRKFFPVKLRDKQGMDAYIICLK